MARSAFLAVGAMLVLGLAACETDDLAGGGGAGGEGLRFGPGFVELDGNKRFGVSYDPDLKAAFLKFTLVGSFSGEAPEPPSEAQWRAAAEKAAPEGCTLGGLEKVDDETYKAVYDCPKATK